MENKNNKTVENKKENGFIDKFNKIVEILEVNVILISKGINYKLMEKLKNNKNNIVVAINVKSESLKKLAYCTKGKVIQSLNELDDYVDINDYNNDNEKKKLDLNKKQNIIGTCSLEIKNITKFNEAKTRNIPLFDDINNYSKAEFKNIIYSPKYKLMKFESKNNDLFLTLLLSGTDKNQLIMIKKLLKEEIFLTAKEFYLQQKVLYFLFCDIPKFNEKLEIEEKNRNNLMMQSKTRSSEITINTIRKRISNNIKIKENPEKNDVKFSENIINIKTNTISNKDLIKKNGLNISKSKSSIEPNSCKNVTTQIQKINRENNNVINLGRIDSCKEEELAESPKFTSSKKKLSGKIFDSSKDLYNKITESNNDDSSNNLISPNINNFENIKGTPDDQQSVITENSKEITTFDLGKNNDINSNINLKKSFLKMESENKYKQSKNEANDEGCYKNGFDISSVILKDENNKDKITKFSLVKLRMCKGESSINMTQKEAKVDKLKIDQNQINIKNEAEVTKKLNSICGSAEELDLIYYNFKDKKDKQFGKFIIEMMMEKNKTCKICNKEIYKHFYYLYNSNCSRIKISYILENEYSD